MAKGLRAIRVNVAPKAVTSVLGETAEFSAPADIPACTTRPEGAPEISLAFVDNICSRNLDKIFASRTSQDVSIDAKNLRQAVKNLAHCTAALYYIVSQNS